MALVPVDAALALLEVHGVARKVPVDQAVAPRVEVESFLPDRRAGQQEGAERAVEGGSDGILADMGVTVRSGVPEAQREHRAYTYDVGLDGFLVLSLEELGVDAGAERIHDLDKVPGALRGDLVGAGVFGPRFLIPEHVPLLVEDRLQVALLAVAEHEAPVGALIASDRGTGGELAKQCDYGRPVEEMPEGVGNPHREPAAGGVTGVCRRLQTA